MASLKRLPPPATAWLGLAQRARKRSEKARRGHPDKPPGDPFKNLRKAEVKKS